MTFPTYKTRRCTIPVVKAGHFWPGLRARFTTKLVSNQPKPNRKMKPKPNKLESYYELITSLEMKLDEVKELKGQHISLKEDAEKLGQKREEVLAGTVSNTTDAAIDHLAKFNARQEGFAAKLKHIEGQIETAEEALQYMLMADFISPFRNLHGALLQHRFERGKTQIAKLIVPERVALMDNLIEQLARQSKEYAADQVLELHLPDGATSRFAIRQACRGRSTERRQCRFCCKLLKGRSRRRKRFSLLSKLSVDLPHRNWRSLLQSPQSNRNPR